MLRRVPVGARGGEGDGATRAAAPFFTGATASVRGSSRFAAFSGAKHGLRALAQSMARELGPKASTWCTRSSTARSTPNSSARTVPDRYALKDRDGILNPEHIAEAYWQLPPQPRAHGPTRWTCGRGSRRGDGERHCNGEKMTPKWNSISTSAARTRTSRTQADPRHRAADGRVVRLRAGASRRRIQAHQQSVADGAVQGREESKNEYQKLEDRALHQQHGLARFSTNPHFPVNTVQIMRGAVARRCDGANQVRGCRVRDMWEASRRWTTRDIRTALDADPASTASASLRPHPGAGREGPAARRTPRRRSSAGPSARRRSSSATRFFGKDSCARSRRRSKPQN